MSDEQIEVRISAKSAELKDGMDGSAQIVEAASARIKASMANLDQEFKKLKDQFQKGLTFDSSSAKAWGDEAKRVFDSTRTAEERLQSETAKLNELLKRGAIDAETHARAIKNLGGSSNEAKGFMAEFGRVTSGISGIFGKLNVVLGAVSAVLAGGAVFAKGVEATKQFTGEANKLAKTLGINATAASALNVALGDVYSDAETYTGAAAMLGRQLRSNEEALQKMGLQTRDANGEYRNLNDLMMDSIKVLNGYKEGTDRNLAAMTMWGRGASEAAGLLKLNAEAIEEAKKKQEELGLVVGEQNIQSLKKYKAAMNDAGDVMLALKKAIGDAVMPVLTKLAEWFSSIGPAAVVVIRGAIGGVISVFWGFKFAVEAAFNVIAGLVEAACAHFMMLANVAGKVLTLDFSGAKAAWQEGTERLGQIAEKRFKNIADGAEDTRNKLADLFLPPDKAKDKNEVGKKSYVDPTEKEKPEKRAESRMGQWETELEEAKTLMQEKANAEGRYYEMSKQEEVAFWQKKLALTAKGSQENLAIRKKLATQTQAINKEAFDADLAKLREEEVAAGNNMEKKLAIAREELAKVKSVYGEGSAEYAKALQHIDKLNIEQSKQRIELAKVTAERERDIKLSGIEAERETARLELDLGNITKEQLLQQEADFEERINTIRRQALLDRQKEIDPNSDPVARAQIDQQLEQQEQQHQQRLSQIRSQITVERAKPQTSIFASMESSYEQALTGMITRTQTWRQALGNIYKQVGTSFVQEMISKPLAQWIAGLAKMLAQKLGFVAADATATKAGAASTIATKSKEATSVVSANAAEAASGGASAVASIPYVGPVMAAAAFASILSMVLGAKSSIKSARGGYDIPAGVNPVTQLHEEEMVLPSRYANAIRDMADGGGASGGGTIHYHDNSGRLTDTEIRRKARVIAEELNRVHRDGWRPA